MCRSPIRIDGSKSRIRPAPGNGFKFSESMRDRIWTLFLDEDASENGSANFWMLKPMTPIQKVGQRYFFRKRQPGQEQFGIYFRDGAEGADQLLLDPAERGTGPYTALKPLRVSPDGRLLLYEVKEGGERTGTFELFDIEGRVGLPDVLPPVICEASHLRETPRVFTTSTNHREQNARTVERPFNTFWARASMMTRRFSLQVRSEMFVS